MAFTVLPDVYKINSISGVDTVGGDATYGYETIQYALTDVGALGTPGTTFELIGTFTMTAEVDLTGWSGGGNQIQLSFLGTGETVEGDGGRPTINTSGGFLDNFTFNGVNFVGLIIDNTSTTVRTISVDQYSRICFCDIRSDYSAANYDVFLYGSPATCYCGMTDTTLVCLDSWGIRIGANSNQYGHIAHCDITANTTAALINTIGYFQNNVITLVGSGAAGQAMYFSSDNHGAIRNICYNNSTFTASRGIYSSSGSSDSHTMMQNYAEGFTTGYDLNAGAALVGVCDNVSYNNTADGNGDVHGESNNEVYGSSGLEADKVTPTATLVARNSVVGPGSYCP